MRSRLAWLLAGVAAAAAAARFLRAPGAPPPAPPRPPDPDEEPHDPRAEELRRRIDDARDLEAEREFAEEAETPVDAAIAPGEDPAARRRDVHERGRAALDRMRGHDD